jgi:hypothetical protein
MTLPVQMSYGWSGEGKDTSEIATDILQTRYRLESDVRALRKKLVQSAKWPAAALALSVVTLVIRRLRRRRRR